MGGGNRLFGVIAAVGLWLIASPSHAKTDYHSGIWNLLRDAHFWFAENGDSRAWLAGSISSGGHLYEIWGYAWEETPQTKAASTEHSSYRVLVFERNKEKLAFVGNYVVDTASFQVRGQTIKFDFGSNGIGPRQDSSKRDDEIVFDNGPPHLILLWGGFRRFDPAAHNIGIWHAMEKGQFRGRTDLDSKIWAVGSISVAAKRYEVWGYSWEEDPKLWNEYSPGHKRNSYKVLVFEGTSKGLSYLGNYERDNVAFRVEGRTVKFDLPKSGRPSGYLRDDPGEGIVFDDKGPPAEARINWVTRPFVK